MTTTADIIEGEVVGDVVDTPTAGEENPSPGTEVAVATPVKPVEKSDLTEKQARALTDKLVKNLTTSGELIMEAYTKRIWLALGHESWGDYLHVEVGEYRVRLPQQERRELAGRMKTEAKMSQHAIADALGWDQKTISNDLKALREVQGTGPGGSAGDGQVVGQDGKVYAETHTRARKALPIEERFAQAVVRADKHVSDLIEISTEAGFADVAGSIAKTHRANMARMIDGLRGVQERYQG